MIPTRKESPHKMSELFWRKEYYWCDTHENNNNTDDSRSDNEFFLKTWKKNKIIKKMMNSKNIILWLITQMNLKWANMMWNKNRLNRC